MTIKTAIASAVFAAVVSTSASAGIELVIGTGSTDATYFKQGESIANRIAKAAESNRKVDVDVDVEVAETNGSIENVEMFPEEFNMIIAQGDVLSYASSKGQLPTSMKRWKAHREAVIYLYNKGHKKDELDELENQTKYRLAMVEGSGAYATLRNFAKEDKKYQKVLDSALMFDDAYEAAEVTATGVYSEGGNEILVAGMLLTGRGISGDIAEDFSKDLAFGDAEDKDFDDAKDISGNKLYTKCEIANAFNPSGWSIDTICMDAWVVMDASIYDEIDDRKEKRAVKKAISRAVNQTMKVYKK